MPSSTCERIANAIFRVEGGNKTKHPYGIMGHYTTDPRHVCIVTINHAWKDFEGKNGMTVSASTRHSNQSVKVDEVVTLPFIQFLGSRYCPPSCDPVGHRNWTNNVWRIINK